MEGVGDCLGGSAEEPLDFDSFLFISVRFVFDETVDSLRILVAIYQVGNGLQIISGPRNETETSFGWSFIIQSELVGSRSDG
jgi:hypothetical protein